MAAASSETDKCPIDKGLDPNDNSLDAQAERYRASPTRRTVFFYNDWRRARSTNRLWRAMRTIPESQVFGQIVSECSVIVLISIAACLLQLHGLNWLAVNLSFFSMGLPCLSLLIVFRTNSSYARWDDARRILGASLNRSRDAARQAVGWFPKTPQGQILKERMMRYVQAWPYSLKCHLRGGPGGCEDDDNLKETLAGILTPDEITLLLQSSHRPMHIMQCMTEIGREGNLPIPAQINLDQNIAAFSDVVGGCERILRTPIPLSYKRMTDRFLMLWLIGLPFSLAMEVTKAGFSVWMTLPVISLTSFLLLSIEEIATQLEEPFSILPMGPYADTCRNNVDGLFV
uniref:Bestrophin homolog n=1 Tax=Eutreptiella gymnastica TaxID=73025 RepID=A0A7S1NT81_9EUGL